MRPGAKFFEWERKGVPIRIELGARDVNNNVITVAIRYNGIKETINIENMDNLKNIIQIKLDEIHETLFKNAKEKLKNKTFLIHSYEEMKTYLNNSSNNDNDNEINNVDDSDSSNNQIGKNNNNKKQQPINREKSGFLIYLFLLFYLFSNIIV
jgi:prolyl-tRNA synthetase